MLIRHPWQLKTVVFLHWCLIRECRFGQCRGAISKLHRIDWTLFQFRIRSVWVFKTKARNAIFLFKIDKQQNAIKGKGAMTQSITTLAKMTLSIVRLNIVTHSIMTVSVMTLNVVTLSIMTLIIMTHRRTLAIMQSLK